MFEWLSAAWLSAACRKPPSQQCALKAFVSMMVLNGHPSILTFFKPDLTPNISACNVHCSLLVILFAAVCHLLYHMLEGSVLYGPAVAVAQQVHWHAASVLPRGTEHFR
jgi:hypothetical protein